MNGSADMLPMHGPDEMPNVSGGQVMERPTIMRKWTATIRSADVDAYARYVDATGGNDYRRTVGYLGHQILVRDLGSGTTEFSTVSWWTDMEAIAAFAGRNPEIAQYYPQDDQYLLSRPETVEHYRVIAGANPSE
jgi:heme-degrading monooxygenase HmoA